MVFSNEIYSFEDEWIQIVLQKGMIIVKRSIQRTTASDADVMNSLYEIARIKKATLIYYSAGTPAYIVEGTYGGIQCPLLMLNAVEVKKNGSWRCG